MKSPLHGGYKILELDTVDSTQAVARKELAQRGEAGAVLAHLQTAGVGRFGRPWLTGRDDSLTMTMIFRAYADHPKPYLIGMAVAVAVAGISRAQLRWPNDVVIGSRKVGGILTELVADPSGRKVPLVGIGLNLNQQEFPKEISDRATSLAMAHGESYEPKAMANLILERLATLPEPEDWSLLSPIWMVFDRTPGKQYVLPTGEHGTALAIGSAGQLICSVEGESRVVLAADAIFGDGP